MWKIKVLNILYSDTFFEELKYMRVRELNIVVCIYVMLIQKLNLYTQAKQTRQIQALTVFKEAVGRVRVARTSLRGVS